MSSVLDLIEDAAEELGYGIEEVSKKHIILIGRQNPVRITIEALHPTPNYGQGARITDKTLRTTLNVIEHRSGWGFLSEYEKGSI